MRPLALIATVLSGSIIAGAAEAQSLHAPLSASANLNILNSAAFAPRSYAPQGPGETVDPTGAASEYEAYVPGEGLVRWMTGALRICSCSLSVPGKFGFDSDQVTLRAFEARTAFHSFAATTASRSLM